MKLDDAKLRETLQSIHAGPLTEAEAVAIVDVVRFTASVDGRMDLAEMATVARVSKIVYEMSGHPDVSVPSAPAPMTDIAKRLPSTGSRELAYATARLITIVDGKVTKEENELGAQLAPALRIDAARAKQIDGVIAALADVAK